MKIADIDWTQAEYLDCGSYGAIFAVSPIRVVKIGLLITPNEVKAQRFFSARHEALRVLDYAQQVQLPEDVLKEMCPKHTWHDDHINDFGEGCICHRLLDVLLMPKAEPMEPCKESLLSPGLKLFMERISADCQEKLGRIWDRKSNNVAMYNGHFVALDFGDPES